ncbi:sentrin-specific protease-like [Anneissia japonica]|uniref:sentrin-specific protease-like n=1 Tax=Anneissia japonica TaxID=1529436 RepID=UPI001425800A|nr:sentrin-specific protease-like [Anneissia japonica]
MNCQRKPNDVMRQVNKICIRYRDIKTLFDDNWLNDVVINGYLELIHMRSRMNDDLPKVYNFKSQWYQKVTGTGDTSLLRWTRNTDLGAYEWLLFPVNNGVYWFLVGINPKNKTVTTFDSMHGENMREMELAVKVVQDDWRKKISIPFTCKIKKDCGVYLSYFVYYLGMNKVVEEIPDIDTKQYRHSMILDLYRGSVTN